MTGRRIFKEKIKRPEFYGLNSKDAQFYQGKHNIMKLKQSEELWDSNTRFLVRHSSSSAFSIFACCSNYSTQDYQSPHPEKPQPQKISIKNMKKSGIFGFNSSQSIQSSPLHQQKQGWRGRKFQLSQSALRQHSQRTFAKDGQRINFVYNKEIDNSVHNYHTTNLIVEKYIVKPQQMNIFVPRKGTQIQQEAQHEKTYQQTQEAFHMNYQSPSNNYHYSFGPPQKNLYLKKFGGFKEVISNRPSKEFAKETSIQAKSENRDNIYAGKRQNLENLVRGVEVDDQQFDDSSSGKSQVIDSYLNFMSRIQEGSRIMSLGHNKP